MTTRLEWCDCRWCFDEHPGGMVLFVTLPSNKYASRDMTQNLERRVGVDDKGELIVERYEFTPPPERGPNVDHHTFGRLMIPPGGFDGRDIDQVVEARIPWACDNGSFNQFNEPRFTAMMDRLANQPYCHFVAAPDVVWNKFSGPDPTSLDPLERRYGQRHLSAIQTIEKFQEWSPYIRERGLPAAMVGQDGLETYEIPWELMDAYFVGGSDGWKTSAESEHIMKEALQRELWVHVGRVSSNERIRWCRSAGASSFDGSAFGRFRDSHDKNDGLGRLQAGLINASAPLADRLFVTDLHGNHELNGDKDLPPTEEMEPSDTP